MRITRSLVMVGGEFEALVVVFQSQRWAEGNRRREHLVQFPLPLRGTRSGNIFERAGDLTLRPTAANGTARGTCLYRKRCRRECWHAKSAYLRSFSWWHTDDWKLLQQACLLSGAPGAQSSDVLLTELVCDPCSLIPPSSLFRVVRHPTHFSRSFILSM